jgi:hypothetical protein
VKSALALAATVTLVWASSPVEAKCMQLELRPQILTKKVQLTAEGGGIVVGTMGAGIDDKTERTEDQPTWKIRGGKKLAVPVITTLAPGLVVYSIAAGTGDLVTAKGKRLGTLTRAKKAVPALAAPTIKAIKQSSEIRKWQEQSTLVELDGMVPATAIAMILFDSKGTALTWNIANPGVGAVRVHDHGHCDVSNGTLPPPIGDKVTLAWVDKDGRLSEKSRPIDVIKADE